MKKYIMPELEIIQLQATDIIATSFTTDLGIDFQPDADTDFMEARGNDWELWGE